MDQKLFLYLMFPKGYQAILYRLVYYIPSIFIVLHQFGSMLSVWLICISTYLFIEGIVCPSRNLLNDLKDYKGDMQRGNRWKRYVNNQNWNQVFVWVMVKWTTIFLLCIFLNIYLLLIIIGLLSIQLCYDHLFKRLFPLISAICIALGYSLRALSIFLANRLLELNIDVIFIVCLAFCYAFYQTLEWRFYESHFIKTQNLVSKPGTQYFQALFIPQLIRLVFGLFVVILLAFFQYLMFSSIEWYFVILDIAIVIFFHLILAEEYLEDIKRYTGSIFAIILFSIVTWNKEVVAVVITLVLPYLLSYHSRIYMRTQATHILKANISDYARTKEENENR